jgi:S-phase kinase-associated protein 1
MSTIELETADGKTFKVESALIDEMLTVKHILSDLGEGKASISIGKVRGVIFSKIIEFLKYHHENPSDPPKPGVRPEICEWDKKFLDVDQSTLLELIVAAEYLNIKPLLTVGCRTVAGMIRGKTPDEIRATFNIVNDFSPEEEEENRREADFPMDL